MKVNNNQINEIRVHRAIHADEVLALLLLRWFHSIAEAIWPGVSRAKIRTFTTDVMGHSGMSQREINHTLFIGCGKGQNGPNTLDEHGKKHRVTLCAATMMAHRLGVRKMFSLRWLLNLTLKEDRCGAQVRQSFSTTLHLVSKTLYVKDPEKVVAWAGMVYKALFNEALSHDINPVSRKEYRKKSKVFTIHQAHDYVKRNYSAEEAKTWWQVVTDAYTARDLAKNKARELWNTADVQYVELPGFDRPMSLAFLETDNDQVNFVGYHEKGIAVLVQRNPEFGNVQIFTNQNLRLDLRHVACLLRKEEIELRGMKKVTFAELNGVDTIAFWHLFNSATDFKPMVFNGSISHPDVPATVIPIKRIMLLVKQGLGAKDFGTNQPQLMFSQLGKKNSAQEFRRASSLVQVHA